MKRTSLPCGHSALALRVTDQGDQRGVDRMASAVMDMFTDSATAELGGCTIATGITKHWCTPAVKARRRRAALHLMLCRPCDPFARSDTAAANQEFTAAVRSARGAHRSQLERKCAHHCRMSPGSHAMHKSLERLAAAPRSRASPLCITQYQGQHARRMLPRRLLWRHSQQKLHGHLRWRHMRSADQWLVHMQR